MVTNTRRTWLTTANDRALRVITWGAIVFGSVGLVVLIGRTIYLLNDPTVEVFGFQLANGAAPAFATDLPSVVGARYETAALIVENLPVGARWLLVGEAAFDSFLGIGMCVIVFLLGMRLLEERPFVRSVTWAIFAAAALVMVTGVFGPFLGALAHAEIASFLGDDAIARGVGASGTEGLYPLVMNIDLSPFGWGLGLGLIAGAFEIGQRMQRDTEGLV